VLSVKETTLRVAQTRGKAVKVVVFGASGRTGRLVVEQALAKRHAVTAFVRNPASVAEAPPTLRVVVGDALDESAVEAVVTGQDAVVSTIGPNSNRPDNVGSASTASIVNAMKRQGVRRLLCISSADDIDSGFLFERMVKPLFLRHVFADKVAQELVIYKSGLDWTIVRPPILRDGPRTGAYRLAIGVTPKAGWRVSRADVADFIVRELGRKDYVHQTVGIAY
jgi:putative NADH-flavin reductase